MPSKKYFTSDKRQDGVNSFLNQVIDVIQEDISGSATRRKYQTFVTGGIGPGVTSSLYQTIYDQDFTLQTANPIADMTVGLFCDQVNSDPRQNLVTINSETGFSKSGNGQLLYDTKHTMMMREKVNLYRQYAKLLLDNADAPFAFVQNPSNPTLPEGDWAASDKIMDACLFINIKRLFARDSIRKETFGLRLYENAPKWYDTASSTTTSLYASGSDGVDDDWDHGYRVDTGADELQVPTSGVPNTAASAYADTDSDGKLDSQEANLFGTTVASSIDGVKIIADIGAETNTYSGHAGGWAYLKHAAATEEHVGIIFYDAGIIVLNLGGSTQYSGSNWGSGATTIAANYAGGVAGKGDGGEGQYASTSGLVVRPVFSPRDRINGVINGMVSWTDTTNPIADAALLGLPASDISNGRVLIGYAPDSDGTGAGSQAAQNGPEVNPNARFYPDLLVSASIDDIVDHIGFTRFSSGSLTACAFQNQTKIQSSIFFCRATASQFNGSTNPTWEDGNGQWLLSNTSNSSPYTYITTVLLYDEEEKLVAIAKLNRPIEKNNQSELTIRVRLDF